jgi:hypothetical protein
LNEDDTQKLRKACSETGNEFHSFRYIPFSSELPYLPTDGPCIVYASTLAVNKVWKEMVRDTRNMIPGVFYNESRFTYSKYLLMLKDRMLNYGSVSCTLDSLISRKAIPHEDGMVFVRPNRDLKEFAGEVVEVSELKKWAERIDRTGTLLTSDCRVIVSKPWRIRTEWRLFLVGSRVVAGSRCREDFRLSLDPHVPVDVQQFATEVADIWTPADVCVMDVCRCGGNLFVLEFNCFNSSGFYEADVTEIVGAVSEYARERYLIERAGGGQSCQESS